MYRDEKVIFETESKESKSDVFIIKYKKKAEYTTIFNDCIDDDRLSMDSLATLVYVMSKPDDWEIKIKNLSNRFDAGRDKVDRAINNLIQTGYMKRVRLRNKNGTLSKTVIYASDKPMFMLDAGLNQEVDLQEKQPHPEIQGMVTDTSQPQTEKPDVVNQEVAPYIQKKHITKENNNNKDYRNEIDMHATPPENQVTSEYPDASVVVFFMKKIEGVDITETTMAGWLRKYGQDYVASKIRVLESVATPKNPAGFLSSAIIYDYKEKKKPVEKRLEAKEQEASKAAEDKKTPSILDAKKWFISLTEEQKLAQYGRAIHIWKPLEDYLTEKNLSVLDEEFVETVWFKPMMDALGVKVCHQG